MEISKWRKTQTSQQQQKGEKSLSDQHENWNHEQINKAPKKNNLNTNKRTKKH